MAISPGDYGEDAIEPLFSIQELAQYVRHDILLRAMAWRICRR